ncbi:hypothetical protein JL722_2495 [Aureococcus anophagefferens]|nr:hypothetical protein JL722_2495 [Aureococcus anophagefferens]
MAEISVSKATPAAATVGFHVAASSGAMGASSSCAPAPCASAAAASRVDVRRDEAR